MGGTMPARPAASPEFRRLVRVEDLGPAGRRFAEVASESERAALALRFGLVDLSHLRVSGTISLARGGALVLLAARLEAEVTQECVVTLAPVASRLDAEFERLYAAGAPDEWDVGDAGSGSGASQVDGDRDDIDPIIGGCIDVGEAAAEQLALELDPYPRAPAATLDPTLPEDGLSGGCISSPPESQRSVLTGRTVDVRRTKSRN